jgi:hypothetical protein
MRFGGRWEQVYEVLGETEKAESVNTAKASRKTWDYTDSSIIKIKVSRQYKVCLAVVSGALGAGLLLTLLFELAAPDELTLKGEPESGEGENKVTDSSDEACYVGSMGNPLNGQQSKSSTSNW